MRYTLSCWHIVSFACLSRPCSYSMSTAPLPLSTLSFPSRSCAHSHAGTWPPDQFFCLDCLVPEPGRAFSAAHRSAYIHRPGGLLLFLAGHTHSTLPHENPRNSHGTKSTLQPLLWEGLQCVRLQIVVSLEHWNRYFTQSASKR